MTLVDVVVVVAVRVEKQIDVDVVTLVVVDGIIWVDVYSSSGYL